MSGRKIFYLVTIGYALVFVIPPLVYVVANFYFMLFDGWVLSHKFGNALLWLFITVLGLVTLIESNEKSW